ncbi:MAG: OmpA family protein [Crocinitomicaceae bacterium]|nr:OmpA family protein [Crocinitomicaceae bacterium]
MKTLLFLLVCFSITGLSAQKNGELRIDTLSVYFDLNASDLSDSALSEVNMLRIKVGDSSIVKLIAFCDTTASVQYNRQLAKRRLNEVVTRSGMKVSHAEQSVLGEEFNMKRMNYNAASYRRVDILYKRKPNKLFSEYNGLSIDKALYKFAEDSTRKDITIQLKLQFYANEDVFMPGYQQELTILYHFLKANPDVDAHIRGHVCCVDNRALSTARAMKVYKFLVRNSIDRNRLSIKGYSNKVPFVWPEKTPVDTQMNRRVDVIFRKRT